MKIKYKMIILLSCVTTLAIFPLSLLVLVENEKVIREKTLDVSRNLAQNIAKASSEELLIDATYDNTHSVMRGLKETEIAGLLDAVVINLEGMIVSGLGRKYQVGAVLDKGRAEKVLTLQEMKLDETIADSSIIRISYPIFITYNNEKYHVGGAIFEFNRKHIYAPVTKIRNTMIFLTLVVFAGSLVMAVVAGFYLTKPLHTLADGAQIIGEGNLSHRILLKSRDEIGKLAVSFNEMANRIQDFTANLEQKVNDRTRELNESLGKIHALKEQQDGDYFLTSILTKPLRANFNTLANIQISFIIEQKKKFQYKNWTSEIGGDLCMSDTIRIGRKEYALVMNADAMGKSIQGAGGALVLGAAFRARILQTKTGTGTPHDPKSWLKESYESLQDIFLSFDGSMYATMMLGLIDAENGNFFFLNIEHPYPILYRDNTAEYLENIKSLSKLGSARPESKFVINEFPLRPGDVLIIGSDGKDDISLHTRKNPKEEEINEDPELALRLVEKSGANLEKYVAEAGKMGTLIDDISLLRIEFIRRAKARKKK